MADNEAVVAPAAPVTESAPAAPTQQAELPLSTEKSTEPVSRREAIAKAMDVKISDEGRARDEKGKFAPKPAEAAPVTPAVVKKTYKYPSSFKPDYKPVFEELAGNEKYQGILDEIERREGEYHKGIEPYKESASFANNIRNVLKPYEQTIKGLNMPPEQAIEALLRAEHQMRNGTAEQKRAYFMQLAQQYGVQLNGEQAEAVPVDPYVQALWHDTQSTKQLVHQFMAAQQKQEHEAALTQIDSFKKTHDLMDDQLDGQPDRTVRLEMADLIDKGLAKGLEDAYERVIWANPSTRAKVLAKQQAETEAKRKEAAQKSVETARTAAVQIKGAPSSAGNSANRPPSGKNRRELISKLVDRGV